MRGIRTFVLCLSGILVSTAAHAATCGDANANDIALFEDAKEAFLNQDYMLFAKIAGPYFPDLQTNLDGYFGPLENLLPDGFERCVTVLQRREAPGLAQDMILFFPNGYDTPIAVLLIGAMVDGRIRMIEFNYNTNISDVLDELK